MKRRASNGASGNRPSDRTIRGVQASVPEGVGIVPDDDALSVLEALAGSIDGPSDWSAEHDHYLYGTPKRGASAA